MSGSMKKVGWVLGVLGALLLVAIAIVFARSNGRLSKEYDVAVSSLVIPSDRQSMERGRHAVEAVLACVDCHGPDLGGAMFMDAQPMGRIPAPNLTRGKGGIAEGYGAEDWDRAIRHGIGRDQRPFVWMPSKAYAYLTDSEMQDIIAYLDALPPVDRELPSRSFGPVGRLVLALGEPIVSAELVDHGLRPGAAVPSGSGADRGSHLVKVSGCVACHGSSLVGGKVAGGDPSWPEAGNLTPHSEGLGRYSPESFANVLRTGKKIDGTAIDPKHMPWSAYARMESDEILAIWTYLQSIEPLPSL